MLRLKPATWAVAAMVVLNAAIPSLSARSKTDVLHMKNGDKITCEIKNLERGRLAVKIDYMIGTHHVDWSEVERIESTQPFQVFWSDGDIASGTMRQELIDQKAESDQDLRRLVVESDEGLDTRNPDDAVFLEQLGRNFLAQLDLEIDVGFSFLKDNDQRQTTIHSKLERLSRRRWLKADLNSFLSRRSDAADSNRHDGGVSYLRLFSDAWFAGGALNFLQSDQQRLDLRTTVSGLGGRLLVRRPHATVAAVGGVVLNQERFFDQESGTTSAELALGTRANWYQFDSTEFQTQLLVYPSVSDAGRYRIVFDTSVYLDLWGDLYVRFNLFDNFDSRPPANTPRNDFGGSTTLGWSF